MPPLLRSRPPGRRSGRVATEPYPPPGPSTILAPGCELSNPLSRLSRQARRKTPLETLRASLFQLAVALVPDHLVKARHPIHWRHVPDCAVQPCGVVMLDVAHDQLAGVVERQRNLGPDALCLDRTVPALDLPIRLRIIWRSLHVRHSRQPNELLEVPGDELRPIVGNDPGPFLGVFLQGALDDGLDVRPPPYFGRISQWTIARE